MRTVVALVAALLSLSVVSPPARGVTILTREHVELNWTLGTNGLRLEARLDGSTPTNLPLNEVVLVVGPAAAATNASSNPLFTNILGPTGATYRRLPFTQNTNLLYLGVGGYGLALGKFVGGSISMRLESVVGPPGAQFGCYQVSSGAPANVLNSRDGIDASDAMSVPEQSHQHFFWAFPTPGVYAVTFSATGTLAGSNVVIQSQPYTALFEVRPVSPTPGITGFGVTNGTAFLSFSTIPTTNYAVEVSHDLLGWTLLTNQIPGTGFPILVTDPAATNAQKFYRARIAP